MHEKVDRQLQQMTVEALDAAREGRWDQVIQLYTQRNQGERLGLASNGMTRNLIEWDQWIIDRVREAHAALGQQIEELQCQRRKLAGIRRGYGGHHPKTPSLPLHTI